jgi:hypothetical protein
MKKRFAVPILAALLSLSAGLNSALASQHKGSEEKPATHAESGSKSKSGVVHDVIELTRDVVKAERKAIIAGALDMTAEESQAFWPVYREYENEISKVGDRLLAVIKDFASNYETLTDEQAKAMLQDYLMVEQDHLKVRRSYVKRFEKVLPPKKLVRFYQVENKIDAAIEFEMASEIPLVK